MIKLYKMRAKMFYFSTEWILFQTAFKISEKKTINRFFTFISRNYRVYIYIYIFQIESVLNRKCFTFKNI